MLYVPPANTGVAVLHQDSDVLVISKPSGLLSVPGRGADRLDSVAVRADAVFPGVTIVHRLDMDTSGVMVLARNKAAHRHLSRQFEQRRVCKTYIARVWAQLGEDCGRVDAPLICDWPNRPRQIVDTVSGRAAITDWEVLAREPKATRLVLRPLTGRSHQLRVHMLSLGHPILGDNLYAHCAALAAADRLQLHAQSLGCHHPTTEEWMMFDAPSPF